MGEGATDNDEQWGGEHGDERGHAQVPHEGLATPPPEQFHAEVDDQQEHGEHARQHARHLQLPGKKI